MPTQTIATNPQGQGAVKSNQDKIMEFRIAQIMLEEEQLSEKDAAIKALRAETDYLISIMEAAKAAGDKLNFRRLRNDVVVLNMRLVTVTLKKYGAFSQDKFQNGCVGLLKAAETFDSSVGAPFPNYACFCIEMEVRAAWSKQNRAFEGKNAGFLDSLDEVSGYDDSKESSRYEAVEDPYGESDIDQLLMDAEVETLFYKIIIPSIEEYGVRSKDIDVVRWRELELQYFMELSMVKSQRQRLTFTAMAKELGTVTQNLRTRHKKVMELIKQRCVEYGYAQENICVRERKSGKLVMGKEYSGIQGKRGHSANMGR
ncbi:RNA polymerase sigma factor SigA [compost metagenome]